MFYCRKIYNYVVSRGNIDPERVKCLTNVIDTHDELQVQKNKYDEVAKRVLADKHILARILKETMKEFENYDTETIVNCIEGEPQIGRNEVADIITGTNTEDLVPNEGRVVFDIKFYVILPDKERTKIIINLEAQNDYYPGYDLVTRGVYYGARNLSSQLGREFTLHKDDVKKYDGIKKVYSIWICTNCPLKVQNTITSYSICQHDVLGTFSGNARYDLMNVVMLYLSSETNEKKEATVLDMLYVLLAVDKTYTEKIRILNEMGIKLTDKTREEVNRMCNLSEGVERRGIEKGIAQGISQGISIFIAEMKRMNQSSEYILSRLVEAFGLSEEEAKGYL